MRTLILMAFRNLFRQKRRNVMLGSAISLATMVLVLANAFAHGISQTLIDRVIAYAAGHVSVGFALEGKLMSQVMRGGAHWKEEFSRIPHVRRVDPTMGVMARVVSPIRSDNAILIAIDMSGNLSAEDSATNADNFPMVAGRWEDLRDTAIENPLILSATKAKYLGVGIGDVLRVRLQDIYGGFQAARLTVVGIFAPSNIFMEGAQFLELQPMRRLMGLNAEDSPYLYLTLEEPALHAVAVADSIWRLLSPPLALASGRLYALKPPGQQSTARLAAYKDSLEYSRLRLALSEGAPPARNQEILLPQGLARELDAHAGDTLVLRYALRYPSSTQDSAAFTLVVSGVYGVPEGYPSDLLLMRASPFYHQFYTALPARSPPLKLSPASPLPQALAGEWIRLPRARTTDEVAKAKRELAQGKYQGTVVMVNTMYESASQILQLENALQIITLGAVMVLFLVILLGVVNTLRMTVKERTREIGTLRALGMQRNEVRLLFLLETGMLASLSALSGILLGFLSMSILSTIPIDATGNPLGILLVHGHLVFAPTLKSLLFFFALIVAIALLSAWFPAQSASKLPAATALRHYD